MKKYLNPNYILQSALILLCLISFIGAVVYRLYSLDNLGITITLILVILLFIIIQRFWKNNKINSLVQTQLQKNKKGYKNFLLFILRSFSEGGLTSSPAIASLPARALASVGATVGYLLLFTSCLYILLTHQTTQAIISPWQVVPSYFFIFYGLATALLILIIIKQKNNNGTMEQWNHGAILLLISLHYFLSFTIAVFIYKLGYGFDPFIHQATMDLINKTGSIDPKPFYYLGQYSLIVILHKITHLPIAWLDKLLVPALAAVYVPFYAWQFFKKKFKDNITSLLLILIILILPFSFFILTTPQNLAYLFLLLILLIGLTCQNLYTLNILYLLALTSLLIQPIAGLPALLFVILLTIYHSDKENLKKYFYILIFIVTATILPLAFYFIGKTNSGTLDVQRWTSLSPLKLIIPNQENFILNFIYLYSFNLKHIFTILVLAGLIIAYRYREKCKIFALYLIMSAALLISYLLVKLLPFNFLIDYERSNYPDRISLIAAFFLMPFVITALYGLTNKILKQNNIIKLSFLIFLIILITTSLYLSYPCFDRYYNSHGYSVSQNDIDAVHWIKDNAKEEYIVLANQQVSAAALREFGFAKYYSSPLLTKEGAQGEVFYYPIPTGGPLYQYYLDMVYEKPSQETMFKAMDLTGVNEAYFVLNKYWWAFPKILAEAKLEADSWQEIEQGEIYVFKYGK